MIESESPATDALPDEDRFAFPASWKRFVQPRRGQGKPRRIEFEAEPGRRFRADCEPKVRECLSREANREYEAAVLAFLGGESDVLGAAAVMALTPPAAPSVPLADRLAFDMTAAEHGLPFAVAAFAESLTLEASTDGPGEGVDLLRRELSSQRWWALHRYSKLPAIRAHVAAASDADHAAVVAALAEHRTDPARRFAVSLIAPDEEAWLDEVCDEHGEQQPSRACTQLLFDLVTTAEQLGALDVHSMGRHWVQVAEIADLLHRLGAAALPVLEWHLDGYCDAGEKKTLFRAIAAIPTDEALGLLVDRLGDAAAMGFAMEAAARFPQRTLRAVAARLPEADASARARFTALLHADPILLEDALPLQDETVREAIAGLTAESPRLPEASADAVPKLLASPPWDETGAAGEAVVVKGLTPPAINRVVWAEGEREAWSETEIPSRQHDRDWEQRARSFDTDNEFGKVYTLALAPREVGADLLPRWEPGDMLVGGEYLKRILAKYGADAAEQLTAAATADTSLRELLLPIANLTAARVVADALVRLKTMRAFAFDWLDRHGADAAALLVPDALGKAKKRRTAAEAALRYVAANGGADLVREAAAQYGDEATAAVAALVDVDPLAPVGVPVPRPGAWVAAPALPQVLLAGRGRALPNAAIRPLATVLALGTPDFEYRGVAVVAETCDRASLTRFSLALFDQWLTAGAPSDDAWALTQLAHFGGDEAVRLLAPLIARWPGESRHHHAVKGLQVLGAIGSEAALRAIQGIAERAKFSAIKAEAGDQIDAIAARLGLSAEQLADRLVPDFGLREESALVLDYGPRKFRVGFDESLKPFVTDMDGKPRKTLPKPGVKDDELVAGEAYRRFAALRKELRTVAADQVKRLERAMVEGRTWTLGEFMEYFVDHPLVWHLARRLVWMAEAGAGPVSFRLAEDRSPTGVDEEELELPEAAVIRLAHPAILGGEVETWAEVFADYEILQPFTQLGRPVMAFTDEELATGRLARFEGVSVPVGRLLGLVGKGWVRGAPQDAGIEAGMSCRLPGVGHLVIALDPGIVVGAVDMQPQQTLREVVVAERDLHGWSVPGPKGGFGPVDPVAASEVLAALAKATEAA
ncbi:DUF4132 domain-containing protein [Glycomyces arizonensis]|uniref:DUF4132 domain-containing protein n=1 Tax=Glycomyces arizonensis TaxID=256035 RepID=UPI0012ECB80C|nr:DUF4132 domain-containing protein [Glycomyces arizonensis]